MAATTGPVTSKAVLDQGGVIVEILAATGGSPPTKADLDNWINANNLSITTVKDPDNLPLQSLNALIRREYCYVVDLSTMSNVQVIVGTTVGGSDTTSAYTGMQLMLQLLAGKSG